MYVKIVRKKCHCKPPWCPFQNGGSVGDFPSFRKLIKAQLIDLEVQDFKYMDT
jgi:hypothetical protein